MPRIISFIILALFISYSSPASGQEQSAPPKEPNIVEAHYKSSDGRVMEAKFNLEEQKVTVTPPGEKEITLPSAESASGARYSNGKQTFWEHKSIGRFIVDDKVLFEGRLLEEPETQTGSSASPQ